MTSENGVEHEENERQPIEPDLFFELFYPRLPKGQQYGYFLYERERGSNNAVKYSLRCRRYFHWIVKQKKHSSAYGVPQIHAVLTETGNSQLAGEVDRGGSSSYCQPRALWSLLVHGLHPLD